MGNVYEINTADICELAHNLTVIKCKEKKIKVDRRHKIGTEVNYTARAQIIFFKYYDLIEKSLGGR